jgi:hypothetical protein
LGESTTQQSALLTVLSDLWILKNWMTFGRHGHFRMHFQQENIEGKENNT